MSQKHAGTIYAEKDSRTMSPMPLFNTSLKTTNNKMVAEEI